MDLSAPYSALLTETVGSLLTTLARTTRPLSGRELARLSDCPPSTTSAALRRFAEHGLVDVQEAGAGAALLYTLNRKHVAADAILLTTSLRQRFIDRLRSDVEGWRIPPLHASLYGSSARGDGDTSSDVDVFLVRPDEATEGDPGWRRQVERLPDLILGWTGNHASIAEVGTEEVARMVREEAPVWSAIASDAIVLSGLSVYELSRHATQ
jgi:DNA-binding transcriptional ArsR family regulator